MAPMRAKSTKRLRSGAPTSFRAFLHTLPAEDSPAGSFVVDAKADKSFPDLKTWAELKGYLHPRGDAALVAGRAIWRRYRDAQRKA
jgi:hypothetical protein